MICNLSDLDALHCAHCRGDRLDPHVPAQVDGWKRALAVQLRWESLPSGFSSRPGPSWGATQCGHCGQRIMKGELFFSQNGDAFCGQCAR